MITSTDVRRADVSYAVLLVGPALAFGLMTVTPVSVVLPSTGSTTEFYAAILLLWGSLFVGGLSALGCRWNRPLFVLGVFALVIAITSIVTNVLNYSAGLLREGAIGSILTVASGIVVVLYAGAALVLTIVWYGFSRRRWRSTRVGPTA